MILECTSRAVAFAALIAFFIFSVATPQETFAALGSGNAMCSIPPYTGNCPFGVPCPPKSGIYGVVGKPCQEEANGKVCMGACSMPGKCEAKSCEGIGGGQSGLMGADKLIGDIFGKLLEKLMGGKQGGGGGGQQGGGGGAMSPQGPLYPTCVRNTATNTVSPIPCTESNGSINYGTSASTNTTGSIGGSTADILLNALGSGTGSGSNTSPATTSNTNTNTNTNQAATQTTTQTPVPGTSVLVQQQQALTPANAGQNALQGDVVIGSSGGMLYARSRDVQKNTEVAGFYGGNTFGQSQSSGVIGRLCGSRPWGAGLLGGLIAPTFFDNLCQRFGYQVGVAVITPTVTNTTSSIPKATITITQPTVTPVVTPGTVVQPEIDIWANPPSVRLGSRTYIFWNARGVDSCKETGPSFSHNTLSGGASTVPLSELSIFTIECKALDGRTVTDSVRVNIAL